MDSKGSRLTATKQPAKPDEERADVRLVAATNPVAFIAVMGKLAEGLAVAKASKEG